MTEKLSDLTSEQHEEETEVNENHQNQTSEISITEIVSKSNNSSTNKSYLDLNTLTTKNSGKPSPVLFWSPECRYDVILANVKLIGRNQDNNGIIWKPVSDARYEHKAGIYWIDVAAIHERFRTIQPWQVINHFPGMPNIARKNRMGQNLNKMLKMFPKEYAFYPKTWVLPGELPDFKAQFDQQGNSLGNKIYIIKPDAGCQGRGIFLTKTLSTVPTTENVVAQIYIKNPLLLDGFKFDLRIYCLVTSVKPLRIYLFQDGLVRMCTEEYVKPNKSNLGMACMHLTNYAVNKRNANFLQPSAKSSEENQDEGSKRSLKWFMNYIAQERGEGKAAWLWRSIGTLCVRSILSIIPTLSREYDNHFKSFSSVPVDLSTLDPNGPKAPNNTLYPTMRGSRCFEILGFDVMIDKNLKPWIIEVNHLPSFGTDSPLDLDIKDRLMQQTLAALAVLPDDEQAYLSYHKYEASRRLVAQRQQNEVKHQEVIAPPKKVYKKPAILLPTDIKRKKGVSVEVEEVDINTLPEIIEPVDNGECKPARFEEIKRILVDIYSRCCADKVSKIDRLLEKYQGREEEFLKYVYSKYNITPPWVLARRRQIEELKQKKKLEARKKEITLEDQPEKNSPDDEAQESQEDITTEINEEQREIEREGRTLALAKKRVQSKSVPPVIERTGRPGPMTSWKLQTEEELAVFRKDILAAHYPKEDDSWMLREMKVLTQFTRIFPPQSSTSNTSSNQTEVGSNEIAMQPGNELEEQDSDEEEDQNQIPSKSAPSIKTFKPASYETIMVEAFLHDKKQAMRMFSPLASNVRVENVHNQQSAVSLPPVRKSLASTNTDTTKATKDSNKTTQQAQMLAVERLSKGSQRAKYPKPVHASSTDSSSLLNTSEKLLQLQPVSITTVTFDNILLASNPIQPKLDSTTLQRPEPSKAHFPGIRKVSFPQLAPNSKMSNMPSYSNTMELSDSNRRSSIQQQTNTNSLLLSQPKQQARGSLSQNTFDRRISNTKISSLNIDHNKEALLRQLFPEWF